MKEKLGSIWDTTKKGAAKVKNFISRHKAVSLISALAVLFVLFGVFRFFFWGDDKNANTSVIVERRDIEEKISDSTIVEPNREYSVTANVSGEIVEDFFEEGDRVNKDDVLYMVDSEAIENSIKSADIAIARAKISYENAVKEDELTYRDRVSGSSSVESAKIAVNKALQSYDDALRAANDTDVTSEYSGYAANVQVSEGNTVAAGSPICDIVDSGALKIDVPFNSADIGNIYVGAPADLTLTKSGSLLSGVVTEVSGRSVAGPGYTLYNNVTIEVANPGAVAAGDTATATACGIACADAGSFEYIVDETIYSPASGKIEHLYISENSYLTQGDLVLSFDKDSADSQLNMALLNLSDAKEALTRAEANSKSADANLALGDDKLSSAVENARLQYEDALISKDNLLRQLEDYTIKAPISGIVATKNKKKGDKAMGMSAASSSYSGLTSGGTSAASMSGGGAALSGAESSALAVIYDMSRLKCTLDVDELDIKNIRPGQRVTITTDVTDKEYVGTVDTVSINGSAGQNGVTTYPVTIDIINFDDNLLPGMNIDADIVLSSVKDVLAIPVSCLNRGDTVYVKGEKTQENDTAPEGYRTVSVTTGATDDMYIQILSGLSEGDEIYTENYNAMEDMINMMESNREAVRNNMAGGDSQ